MDSSLIVRPRDPKSNESLSRRVVGRSNVVRTDLSASQSVNATETATGLHHTPLESRAHEPAIDPNCQSLLDREREQREKDGRRRARDEALARQRAYGRNAETPAASSTEETAHTDIAV